MQALVFAAGLGTRLKPLTDTLPKALVNVTDSRTGESRPMIDWLLPKLYAQGFDRIVINVHHFAPMLVDHVERYLDAHPDWNLQVTFSDESAQLLNTGGGIKKAARLMDPSLPFLVHNVDIVSNLDLQAFYRAHRPSSLATLLVSERKTARYFLFDAQNRLVGWTNLETGQVRSPYPNLDLSRCQKKAFAGTHVISPAIVQAMENWPDVFSIVDFYLETAARAEIVGVEVEGLQIKDMGKINELSF